PRDLRSFPTRRSSDLIERLAVDTHPVAQAIAGRVVERYPGRMHTGTRCLAGYEQTCRRTSPDHRSRLMRQWPAQRLLHAYATGPDRKSTRLNSSHVKI